MLIYLFMNSFKVQRPWLWRDLKLLKTQVTLVILLLFISNSHSFRKKPIISTIPAIHVHYRSSHGVISPLQPWRYKETQILRGPSTQCRSSSSINSYMSYATDSNSSLVNSLENAGVGIDLPSGVEAAGVLLPPSSLNIVQLVNSSKLEVKEHNIEGDNSHSFVFTNEEKKKLDKEFVGVALPAFVGLSAEPLMAFIDSMYVGRLGAVEQAGLGIAISAQYSIAKLYNDPLLKTSTSLVAGKSGDELSASVTTAISTAMFIGVIQFLLYTFFTKQIISFMGVSATSAMREPSIAYLRWRALGVPAATVLLVSNSIFRGRGDTKTPLYCTTLGNLVNIILDPILIFTFGMGCAGAGAANAISQWVTAIPLLYLLNKSIPLNIPFLSNFAKSSTTTTTTTTTTTSSHTVDSGAMKDIAKDKDLNLSDNKLQLQLQLETSKKPLLSNAVISYFKAGGLILLRTIAKISAYTITSAAAARLGTVSMAAYSLTFNMGFATTQLCESLSVAAQALLARDVPFNTKKKEAAAAHIMNRALLLGLVISSLLTASTWLLQDKILSNMTKSPAVIAAVKAAMPVVLIAQIFKGLTSSTGGILLGGLDWFWSTATMSTAAILCVALTKILPPSLTNLWVALTCFMATQLIVASSRIFSGKGPWKNLTFDKVFPFSFINPSMRTRMEGEMGRKD